MPTPIDRAVSQRGPFFAFAAVITGVAAWSIWGQDLFPSRDPTGDPDTWTHEQCVTWLNNRNLHPSALATTAELLERIKANMRVARERTPLRDNETA
ncbi:hypothetical protein HBI56_039410 [Parastagonospora nodorum]|uniref:STE24 endopeptidase n=2 Tax=Phaeosphaeria nodorum (strain SN15 / ATCC MYA-4574 / FGSC 10173) TaxID=321614 RepID=A0A7U2HVI0_PHANO|nr:hypothetical protein SNOG_03649 [Parastagonospora nodorum SN15]KAH3915983.1 hypothetical protein HBH56_067380 [Parastagonospora nodorum]EAT88854.1 hypothetical protein SNOG_03649 [Parastagonospora nodorum SN15]KAH3932652.1 hypothetical protein HBH54_080730 [Parastagonospora nodorum]KAH3954772.1 hypothetical protein HBH53_013680 [Parastagonospora nodorum]KAH3986580.1 hypothetical protein HBH52_044860 [Parastagonospora nodorum]